MRNDQQWTIYINKNEDDAELLNKPQQAIETSGTFVEMGDIEKRQLKDLSLSELKKDIEIHFEMLLKRNVFITLKDEVNEVQCEPFNYDEIEGIPIKGTIEAWVANRAKTTTLPNKAIEINLKVCKSPINRPVYFSGKGRKISNVTELRSFMNYVGNYGANRNVWNNPLVTGYIEVKDILRPTVHRNDFEAQAGKRTGVYSEIVKFEGDIFDAIQKEMQNKTDEGMKNLGSALTDILSKLAREDLLNLRKLDDSSTDKSKEPTQFEPSEDGSSTFTIPGGEEPGPWPTPGPGPDPRPGTADVAGDPDPSGEKTGLPSKPKKQGMQIELMTGEAPSRAFYSDGLIYIYVDHPDFQTRVKHTRGGDLAQVKITARLANYLAAIIASKYKDQFYQQKKLEPERDKVLDEQIEFIFRFENAMQDFIDQRLDKIGEIVQ